jgi:FKBP-type peptidyl-prolyl cis-trans isomerase FkpA
MRSLPLRSLALVPLAAASLRAQAPAATPTAKPAAKPAAKGAAPALATDLDKTLYAIGQTLGRNLEIFALSPAELEVVKLGMADVVLKVPPKAPLETWGPRINALVQERLAVRTAGARKAALAFVEQSAQAPGAVRLPSGMVYVEVEPGTGAQPTANDQVKVHYVGTLADGKEFDSSRRSGRPAEFGLSGVIPCWTEGVARMKVGGKARLVCPPQLGYGDRGAPPDIPGGAALVFEIELLDIVKKP